MTDGLPSATRSAPADRRRRGAAHQRHGTAAGGLRLWAGTVAFGGSTVAVLAVLSRHFDHATFAALAALLSLSFVVSLIPAGLQLRSAALVADGHPAPTMTVRQMAVITAISLAVAPVFALVLRVPVAAASLVTVQMVVAIPLASRQGALLAHHRFGALGTNLVIEGLARVALGSLLGVVLGVTGLAAGLCGGTIVALIVLPYRRRRGSVEDRPRTSLVDTSLSLAILGLYVQLDVLVAPSVVGHGAATAYDLAAVPSKGVYLVLLAAGPMLFPFVRRQRGGRRLIVRAAATTLAAGGLCTGLLVAALPLIAAVLGQGTPGPAATALLGWSMALAGATAVVVSAGVARGVARPWPPLLLGVAAELLCLAVHPDPWTFTVVVTLAQLVTTVLSLSMCLFGRQRAVVAPGEEPVSADGRTMVAVLAEAGDRLAVAQASNHPNGPPRSLVDRERWREEDP
jgi:hypothetical protein